MWSMLQQDEPNDFVVATGEDFSVKDFLGFAFNAVGLEWSDYVEVDSELYRPSEVDHLRGNPAKAKKILDWEPKVKTPELAKLMVEAELSRMSEPSNLSIDRPFG